MDYKINLERNNLPVFLKRLKTRSSGHCWNYGITWIEQYGEMPNILTKCEVIKDDNIGAHVANHVHQATRAAQCLANMCLAINSFLKPFVYKNLMTMKASHKP